MSALGPLVIVPCDPRTASELDVAARCLVSLAATAPGAEVVLLGDPAAEAAVLAQLQAAAAELGFGFGLTPVRRSLAAGVNPALEEAREDGRDAVVLAPDVELAGPGWLEALAGRTGGDGRPAAVAGGRLLYPDGLIEHAGLQFSLLAQRFVESFRFGPASLREARVPRLCPVGPGLVLIRPAALRLVGLLDEDLAGAELVDFCLRCFAAGLECVYEPAAVGTRNAPHGVLAPASARREVERRLLARHAGHVARWAATVTA